jgi:hypothetical protein
MNKTQLKDTDNHTIAFIDINERTGIHTITDQHHRAIGYYDPRTNQTKDASGGVIGYGYLLPALISSGISESGTTKPKGPLNSDQLRKRNEKEQRLQQQIRDQQTRNSIKMQELRTKVSDL